jgi:hypothetical protein
VKFIYNSLLSSFIFFVLYTTFLSVFPKFQNHFTAQNWWQENKIKAENFFNQKQPYDLIIVGTSMSEGLKLDQYKGSALTINFIGGSSLTGLELIKRSSLLPKRLIIETNWLEREANDDLISNVSNHNFDKLKSIAPALLESNQPVNVLASSIKIKPSLIDTTKEKMYFLKKLQQNIEAGNVKIDTASVEKTVKKVRYLINYFREKGVKVYLMELPVNKKLYNVNRFSVTKLAIKKFLIDVDTIPKFNSQSLATSDGYHLTLSSKKIYTNYLNNFLNRLK